MKPSSPDAPDGIAAALESYAATRPSRTFGVKETAIVLAIACMVAVLLDSEGLLAWARRLEVGTTQAVLLRVLGPLHSALVELQLDQPRTWAARARDVLDEDPILAEGWSPSPCASGERVGVRGECEPTPKPEPTPDPKPEPAPDLTPEVAVTAAIPAQPQGGVLLLGDSMIAGSLGATLERTLEKSSGLRVTRAAQLGTGLARPDLYDWMKVVPPLLQREQPRFVVVSLGANDATNLLEGDDQVDYGTTRWRQVYAARVETMMRALTAERTRVLWLTLPPMRDRRLSARAAFLNSVFAQCARKVPRVEFLEVDLLIGDAQRQYATFVQSPEGKLQRYRLDDGVHLAPAGSRAVAVWVRDWVRERNRAR
jgi:uncharacterized protein